MKHYPIEIEDDDTTTNEAVDVEITPEIQALAGRPYAVVVTYEEDSGWVGRVPDLPGLVVAGETANEMMELLQGAKEVYIASLLRHGDPVPIPRPYEAIVKVGGALAAR